MASEIYTVNFDYSDAPTLQKFAKTRKRISLVVGPFGSGKSSACTMKIYEAATQQKPDSHGIRRTRWAVVRNCYDDQTEILTESRGWQLFRNLEEEDHVATLHGNALIYEKPRHHYQADYEGEMIGVKSDNLDLFVTPDHKFYVSRINGRNKRRSKFLFPKASEIYGKTNYEFKMDAEWDEWEGKNVGGDQYFYEFLGFWFAEGSAGLYHYANRKKSVCRVVLTQKKNIPYVENLLKRCDIEFHKNFKKDSGAYDFVLKVTEDVRALANWLVKTGIAKNKYIPNWIKTAPRSFLRAFIHGYLMGDGHIKDGPKNITRGYTASKTLANDLQEIALKAGYAAIIHKRKNREEYNITFLAESRRSPNPRKQNWYKKEYKGKVYCVEVSTHVIYVRRNGKPVWCSQTYPQLRDTTIKTFLEWFPAEYFGNFRMNPTPDYTMVRNLSDGTTLEAEFLFRALDKPEHVKNLLSLEVTGCWFNELREIAKTIWDHMDGRIDRFPPMRDGGATWAGMIADTNPCDTDHWVYKLFVEELPNNLKLQEKYDYFHQPSGRSAQAENLRHLKPNYYENLCLGKDPQFVAVYADGQYGYVREGKIIYTNYQDAKHCAKEPLVAWKGIHLTLGWDFGLTPSCIILQYHPKGWLNILHELCAIEMGLRNFALNFVKPYILATYPGWSLISGCDLAGTHRSEIDETMSCIIELKNMGFNPHPAWTNNLDARFSAVDNFLQRDIEGRPALLLSPTCKMLRKGFNGEYKRRRLQISGEEIYSDTPEKNAVSHPHEALQYACMIIERGMRSAERFGWATGGAVSTAPPPKLAWA